MADFERRFVAKRRAVDELSAIVREAIGALEDLADQHEGDADLESLAGEIEGYVIDLESLPDTLQEYMDQADQLVSRG